MFGRKENRPAPQGESQNEQEFISEEQTLTIAGKEYTFRFSEKKNQAERLDILKALQENKNPQALLRKLVEMQWISLVAEK